jgi:hypothetical protein
MYYLFVDSVSGVDRWRVPDVEEAALKSYAISLMKLWEAQIRQDSCIIVI